MRAGEIGHQRHRATLVVLLLWVRRQDTCAKDSHTNMSEPTALSNETISDETRQRLRNLRRGLLHLHKLLLERERAAYEQAHGRVESSGELLQLVINHEQFAWLRRVSELIVQIDETLDGDEPGMEANAANLLRQSQDLLKPSETGHGFAKKYYDALQRDPGIVLAHAEVSKLLA